MGLVLNNNFLGRQRYAICRHEAEIQTIGQVIYWYHSVTGYGTKGCFAQQMARMTVKSYIDNRIRGQL
jgi:hypothetical protein